MTFAKYWEIGKINVSNSFMYVTDVLANSLFIGLIIFVFINLWKAVYGEGSGLIEGFTINMMVWYLVLTESIVTSPGRVTEDIGKEIQSGDIAQNLNKPYNYFLFKYSSVVGNSLLRFVTSFVIGGVVTFIFLGGINVSYSTLPIVLISVFLAITLTFLIMAFLGVVSFWIEDSQAIHFIYTKFVFVLGGMLVPLEIFPQWLEAISRVLPFSYVAYHPAKLFVSFNMQTAIKVLINQLIWIVVLIIGVSIIYKICIRKISINGG